MVTAIVSVMTGIPTRRDVAMTDEITLRGRVWPISTLCRSRWVREIKHEVVVFLQA